MPSPPSHPTPPTATSPFAASAVSGHFDTRTAASEVAGDLFDHIGTECDVVVVFSSFHHRAAFAEAMASIRRTLRPATLLAVTAESVLGVNQELEGLAGFAALAMRVTGMHVHPWSLRPEEQGRMLTDRERLRSHIGADARDLRGVIMLADPFSTQISQLLPAMVGCVPDAPPLIVGGMSSGASQPGHNAMALGDAVLTSGAAGLTLSGAVEMDVVLSQGCRPTGKPLVVTKCQGNVIQELGGRPAVEVLQELASEFDEHERELLSGGLLLGTVINEYKDRFGRGDFLVRNILGYDKAKGAIAVGDTPRVGQTVQFHVRDAETAHEDLQLLLDAQQLKPPPLGALLFTCNGRGSRLFKEQHHDTATIRDRLGEIPLAGFFAAGEIGPIGRSSFVHGHTASLAIFRA